jgi:hypothetical protein
LVFFRVKENSNEMTAYPLVIDSLRQMGPLSRRVIAIEARGRQRTGRLPAHIAGRRLLSLKGTGMRFIKVS